MNEISRYSKVFKDQNCAAGLEKDFKNKNTGEKNQVSFVHVTKQFLYQIPSS